MSDIFIERLKINDKYKLTNMTDPKLIPQLIEGPTQQILKQVNDDITTYMQNKLIALNIDPDIIINQTAEINRLNNLLRDIHKKEEAGLLVELPYKVGERFWLRFGSDILKRPIPVYLECLGYSITMTATGDSQVIHVCEVFEPTNITKFNLKLFKECAKTFSTKEECEAYVEQQYGEKEEK